jgi:ABC-type dipeptide/oligopeptide/nickel transport system permease subunit
MSTITPQKLPQNKTLWICLTIIVIFGLVALLAPVIAPHDPFRWGIEDFSLPPMWVHDAPSPGVSSHPLGTDRYGRDILSRMIYGARTAFSLAFTAVPLAALIGVLVGLLAGDFGGRVDGWLMGISDIFQSLSGIMFAVIIILIFRSILSPSWLHGMLALVIGFAGVSWVTLARLVRVNVLIIKSQPFVEAAISIGATRSRILFLHVLPNLVHIILVWIIVNIPAVILLEAVLGYIGVPVTSSTTDNDFTVVSWGGLFFSGRSALSSNPLMVIIPSVSILLLSMSFILLADSYNESFRRN